MSALRGKPLSAATALLRKISISTPDYLRVANASREGNQQGAHPDWYELCNGIIRRAVLLIPGDRSLTFRLAYGDDA
jgi:hypothetical protein